MYNKTHALASRITRELRNENVISISSPALESVSLVNATTGKTFYSVSPACVEHYGFMNVLFTIKQEPGYPAPKAREPRMVAKTHGAPKYVAQSMGRFVPGKLVGNWE